MTAPSLLTLVRRAIREHALVSPGDVVLVAVSGGPDSLALLDCLALARRAIDFELVACGVDHGLRPEASAELALAAACCEQHGVAMTVAQVTGGEGGNLHARAREARRAALLDAAARARARSIATGHHADDRAETVLLRLLRGSGPRGLACLPPRDGPWIRPLCLARRTDVSLHVKRRGIVFASDPSNAQARFARTQVRERLLPLMAELSPSIVEHLNGLADDLARLPEAAWPRDLSRRQRRMAERAGRPVVVRTAAGDRTLGLDAEGFVVTESPSVDKDAQD